MDHRHDFGVPDHNHVKDPMTSFSLKGKKVTIIGAGKSGIALAEFVVRLGGIPKISDNNPAVSLGDEFRSWAKGHNVLLETGGHTKNFIEESDVLVISPGVRIDAPPVLWARAKNIPVMGEIELAYRFCTKPIIAVTGSNGKTTTVNLIKEVIEHSGKRACLCGNVGTAFASQVLDLKDYDYVVLEVSSFQMESIIEFKPYIAVWLNFTQNHLDRHKDLQEYFDAKKRLFMNQTKHDFAVLNAQDPWIAKAVPSIRSSVRYFNDPQSPNTKAVRNPNHLAVMEVGAILGISAEACREVFAGFKGVEHRLEFVRNLNGVDFVNDSKATTVESGRWALESIQKPILMICGGRDKNLDYSVLRDLVKIKVKKMLVIGEAQAKLKDTFENVVSVEECGQLESAVRRAKEMASPGDCVLLSPMCASFDMFKNYEERGKVFKKIVQDL